MSDADRETLLALASRCEQEEPSRELDAAIAVAVGIRHRTRKTAIGVSKGREWLVDSHGGVETWSRQPPAYTTSRDAAASLMPENLTVNIITGGDQGAMTYVDVLISGDIHWCDAQADTEAQARTSAALRARAA